MAKNERISELILEIEFGINKIDVKEDTIVEGAKYNINEIEQKANDNLLKLEKVLFDYFLKEKDTH